MKHRHQCHTPNGSEGAREGARTGFCLSGFCSAATTRRPTPRTVARRGCKDVTVPPACKGLCGRRHLEPVLVVVVETLCVRCASTDLVDANAIALIQTLWSARTHATPHRYTASTARRRDTLECTCCLMRVRA
jgi:hypothetical protein